MAVRTEKYRNYDAGFKEKKDTSCTNVHFLVEKNYITIKCKWCDFGCQVLESIYSQILKDGYGFQIEYKC